MYHSQIGQDKIIDKFFNYKENGTFIDVGANDGILLSNTYFFEKIRNWKGICIEPRIKEYEKLKQNRNCECYNVAISNYDGIGDFYDITGYPEMLSGLVQNYEQLHLNRARDEGGDIKTIQVNVNTLQSVIDRHKLYNIDYCSIDTEGSEFEVIKSIDFSKTNIVVFSIENNYKNCNIQSYLALFGYRKFIELDFEDIYVKS